MSYVEDSDFAELDLPFCSADQDSTSAQGPTPAPPAQPQPAGGQVQVYTGDLQALVGPASSPELGDDKGNVPLDALQHHRWIYDSAYYKSLVERANLDNPTRSTSSGQRLVIDHFCFPEAAAYCQHLRNFLAPNIEARTNGQVKLDVRLSSSITASLIPGLLNGQHSDSGTVSAGLFSDLIPALDLQDLLGLHSSNEQEFAAGQSFIPDLERVLIAEYGGKVINRSWHTGGDIYLFCNEKIVSVQDVANKRILGFGDAFSQWFTEMGATVPSNYIPFTEIPAVLESGDLDCAISIVGTAYELELSEVTGYMIGPFFNFAFYHNVMGAAKWTTIPRDLQQIILEEAAKSELEELCAAAVQLESGVEENRAAGIEQIPFSDSLNVAVKENVFPRWIQLLGGPNDPIITGTFNNTIGPVIGMRVNPDGSVSSR